MAVLAASKIGLTLPRFNSSATSLHKVFNSVLTIEPGLYVRPAPGVPEQFNNIGIRIEDDAIVTETGCELITRGVPVKADEIEALMKA
eukprot:gene10703-biopygen9516